MDMELVVKRKVTKLVKTWAPVLLLMGLLIAVDSLDSVQGESFLNKMKLSVGLATQRYHHLRLPVHTIFPSTRKTNKNTATKHTNFWKARHLLGRHTPPGANPTPATPHFGPVPPPPQLD
ncbi:hypothetical protein KC19_2G285500 [Ceratodon purpureus]|uniref:Uncharacterized protein n=1 Tax=Ceratodon purpureus TaxID=3225 RepID=A0A8T0J1C8_CERPU|nr:hypothetical protein KC19_2G285500 [Ceratodon purpureus]KAG0589012.1 hypothetical protein KC19_2G285500 [Ceratodon purpureus]